MARFILDVLGDLLHGEIGKIVFPAETRTLLGHLATDDPVPSAPAGAPIKGTVKASAADSAGGFANLDIAPLGPSIPFTLRLTGPAAAPTGFQFDLEPASGLLRLPTGCRPAAVQLDAAGKRRLVPVATPDGRVHVTLNGADPLGIRTEGSTTRPVRQGLVALDAAGRGVMAVGTDPTAFMIGDQGCGIHLGDGFTVDSSSGFAPDPAEHSDGHPVPSELASWTGVAIRKAELFLPEQTPLLGNGPIPIEFEFGLPRGMYGHTKVVLRAEGSRPEITASLTWDDPGAATLASALPTAIELCTTWTLDHLDTDPRVGTIQLLGGRPLRVTARFARKPETMGMEFGLVVEAGGDQGLLTVKGNDTPGKVVVTASALATAFIADADPPAPGQTTYDGSGATLHALLVAAAGLSAFLDDGSVTLHGVEIDAGLASAGTKLTLRIDYSVDVQVTPVGLGFMSIEMKHKTPMRLRYRNVRMLVDFAQSGPDRFHLSFGEAEVGVEDPGGWRVKSPGSLADLFDVVSSRSGHGSQWFEIDLRFALDLGPVKVSGATVRATLGPGGAIKPEIRGLDASIVMPALLEGRGKASLGQGHLDLGLSADIVPLNLGGFASVSYADCDGFNKLIFSLGVDLPGPIPLASSGLGLYGLGGVFGVNAALSAPAPGEDPVMFQLKLNPFDTSKYGCAANGSVFGLGAVIGTAPDLGYAFSARAVIVLGLPDFALRASLTGKVLSGRVKMAGFGEPPSPGLSFIGLLAIAPDGVSVALRAHLEVPVLFTVDVPFAAYFPLNGRASDWWVHLGSDDVAGRSPGPVQARVLPDLLNVGASAFLMVHGDGLPSLGGDPAMSLGGFALGFGAGFTAEYGVPLVYLELTASAVVGLGTDPFMLAGRGHLAGSLHLGPVSIGASADLSLLVAPDLDEEWIRFDVCGEVDLFFFSLKGCVSIEIGEEGSAIPPPTQWPLKSIALSDHLYTKTADAVVSDIQPPLARIPTVWPDAIPILQFSTGPANALRPGPFSSQLFWDETAVGNGVVGNDRLSYTYSLDDITLTEIDPATHVETAAAGPYEAAWQDSKGGERQPGARELALMTWETHLWTRKLLDGAQKHPGNPLPSKGSQCNLQRTPYAGWALGVLGFRHEPEDAWQLPTVVDRNPFASNFVVRVASFWLGMLIDESTAGLLFTVYPLALGGPRTYPEFKLPGARFIGTFTLPHLTGIPLDVDQGELDLPRATLTTCLAFSEPLFDPELVVALPEWPGGYSDRFEAFVLDENGFQPLDHGGEYPGPDDTTLRVFARPGGPYLAMAFTYPPDFAPEIVGVQATTGTAQHNADSATSAANGAGEQAKAKANSPTAVPRKLLKPNTIYRIDVTTSAQGQREGKKAPAPLPARTDRYWFKTAPLPGAAPSGGRQYLQGADATAAKLHYDKYVHATTAQSRHDDFDPTYLRRYIASWLPADRTRSWFLDDPVGVQLLVSHVPDLALLYRHDVTVKVRRLDPTKGNPDPNEEQEFSGRHVFAAGMSVHHPAADRLIHKFTSQPGSCPYPIPGGTLGARPRLQPFAQYEVLLAFPYKDGPGGTHIEGIVFETSRYRTPLDLLAVLGFPSSAAGGGVTGDVKVERIPVTGGDTAADGEIEQTLGKLGLGRRPTASEPKTTALWAQNGNAWELHGVLLEAPEPIHRPDPLELVNFGGRIKVDALATGGRPFERVMRSASGDRLLFLTGAHVVPADTLDLAITLQDVPLETATVASQRILSCPIGASPAFLGDLR